MAVLIGVCCGTYLRLVDSAPMRLTTRTITIFHPKMDAFETFDWARVWRYYCGTYIPCLPCVCPDVSDTDGHMYLNASLLLVFPSQWPPSSWIGRGVGSRPS